MSATADGDDLTRVEIADLDLARLGRRLDAGDERHQRVRSM